MRLVSESEKISLEELKEMSKNMFGDLVKAVVDSERGIMVVDAAMHSDQEIFLLESGSLQHNLWGINIHPNTHEENWIEFDSMINLRPSFGNKSRGVEDIKTQAIIKNIVTRLVKK